MSEDRDEAMELALAWYDDTENPCPGEIEGLAAHYRHALQRRDRELARLQERIAELEREKCLSHDREFMGRLVRKVWMDWAQEQPDPKPSWLTSWEDLPEPLREVDRRIAEEVAKFAVSPHILVIESENARLRAALDWLGNCVNAESVIYAGKHHPQGLLGAIEDEYEPAAALAQQPDPGTEESPSSESKSTSRTPDKRGTVPASPLGGLYKLRFAGITGDGPDRCVPIVSIEPIPDDEEPQR